MWSKLGILTSVGGLGFLSYDVLTMIMGLAHSDKLHWDPIRPVGLFGMSNFVWIFRIPNSWAQRSLLVLMDTPLFVLILGFGLLCFLFHMLFQSKQ